jgi:hypothetical protein
LYLGHVALPLLLLLWAGALASAMAFGASPYWGRYQNGIEFIMICHRMQWLLAAGSLLCCVGLIAMISGGRRRAWWLVGLAPVLALFAHRFVTNSSGPYGILDEPAFVSADAATLDDGDYVVGTIFNGEAYAYPFAILYADPVVIQSDQDKHQLLIWSAFANRGLCIPIERTIHGRELQIVSMPANMPLLYNQRSGQFINGITGRTMDNQSPTGLGLPSPATKTTWRIWHALHPTTHVLAVPANLPPNMPNGPVLPYYPMPPHGVVPGAMPVVVIDSTPPAAADLSAMTGPAPRIANFHAGASAVLLITDPVSGLVRVFDRQVNQDLVPTFHPRRSAAAPTATMIDSDSGSYWTSDGLAVDGPMKGQKLMPIGIDENVYYDVVAPWFSGMKLTIPTQETPMPAAPAPKPAPGRSRRGSPGAPKG